MHTPNRHCQVCGRALPLGTRFFRRRPRDLDVTVNCCPPCDPNDHFAYFRWDDDNEDVPKVYPNLQAKLDAGTASDLTIDVHWNPQMTIPS